MRRAALVLRRILVGVAVVCLGSWTAVKVYAYVEGFRNQALLEHLVHDNQGTPSTTDAHARPSQVAPPHDGALLGRIDLDRVGLSTFVLEGTRERWLEEGAGHVPGTALPGTDGNAVIAGHRDSFFRGLRRVELGDVISLTTPSATRRYVVDSFHIVNPDDTHALIPSTMAELTLITCFPFAYVGAAPQRFVVHAHAIALDEAQLLTIGPPAFDSPKPLQLGALHPGRPNSHLSKGQTHGRAVSANRLPAPGPPLTWQPPAPRKLPWWKRLFHRHAHPHPPEPQ
ncbi:MAG: class D sortase [Thermoanaerobaculales bacterium]